MNMLFIRGIDVGRTQFNVKNYNKHEILLLDKCLLYFYLHPDWVGQYLETYQNNIKQIYSAVSHDVWKYRDTLLP